MLDEDWSWSRVTCSYCGQHAQIIQTGSFHTLIICHPSCLFLYVSKRDILMCLYIFLVTLFICRVKCLFVSNEPERNKHRHRSERGREDEQTSLYLIHLLYAVHVCYHDDQNPVATHVFYCTEQSMV